MNEERERATESLWVRLVEAMRGGDQEEADRLVVEIDRAQWEKREKRERDEQLDKNK